MRPLYLLIISCLAILSPAFGQGFPDTTLEIDAKCNVYYYNLMQSHANTPGGAGLPPVEIDVRGLKQIRITNVTGMVDFMPWNDSSKECSADGDGPFITEIAASKGFSGISHPKKAMFLVGVFTSPYAIPESVPESMNFEKHENYTVWGPEMNQVFFIGDGQNNKGEQQTILVPTDAEKLYLGFADGLVGLPRNYSDNEGKLRITATIANKPHVPSVKN